MNKKYQNMFSGLFKAAEAPNKGPFGAPLRGGFTLTELLVVVLIIGVLAAVALPRYQIAVMKSRAAEALVQGRALLNAQKIYLMNNAGMDFTLQSLDYRLPEKPGWKCLSESGTCYSQIKGGPGFEVSPYYGPGQLKLFCNAAKNDAAQRRVCSSFGPEDHESDTTVYYLVAE